MTTIVPSEGVASSTCSSAGSRSCVVVAAAGSTGSESVPSRAFRPGSMQVRTGSPRQPDANAKKCCSSMYPLIHGLAAATTSCWARAPSPDAEGYQRFRRAERVSGYTYVFSEAYPARGGDDAEAADLIRHRGARRRFAADGLARAQQQPVGQCRNARTRARRRRAAQLQGRQERLGPAAKPIAHARLAVRGADSRRQSHQSVLSVDARTRWSASAPTRATIC